MERTKRDRRSYSAGEWGRNRVRVSHPSLARLKPALGRPRKHLSGATEALPPASPGSAPSVLARLTSRKRVALQAL